MDEEHLTWNEELLENIDEANGDANLEVSTERESRIGIDTEMEAIQARVMEMEEEAEQIRVMQVEVDRQMAGLAGMSLTIEEKEEVDTRSIYVGNVDYSATAKDLESHFKVCGTINRVTILCNRDDGTPKGYAYIEFMSKEFVDTALTLDGTLVKDRPIKVVAKRTNTPGMSLVSSRARSSVRGRAAVRVSRASSHSSIRRCVRRPTRGHRRRANYDEQ